MKHPLEIKVKKSTFYIQFVSPTYNVINSLVPEGGLVCDVCPLVLSAWVVDPLRVSKISGTFVAFLQKMAPSEERSSGHSKQVRW